MKVRNGFVSNSSSSSFTCDFCGESYAGYGGEYDDDVTEMCCRNGHVLCGHILEKKESKQSIEEKRRTLVKECDSKSECKRLAECADSEILEIWGDENDDPGDMPSAHCPICQFHKLLDKDVAHFLLVRVLESSRETLAGQIKKEFGTYEKFRHFLKKNPILGSLGAETTKV